MGCVQQAVLEFDEEVQAPWRPRLVAVPDVGEAALRASPAPASVPPESVEGRRLRPSRPAGSTRRPGATGRPLAALGPARTPPPGGRPSRPGTRRPGSVRLRLTRRARRLAVVLALAAGVALGSWLGPLLAGGSADALRLAGESSVIVQSGDTLWSIATALDGDGDVRALVDEIQRLNDLDGGVLVPGQVLQLP